MSEEAFHIMTQMDLEGAETQAVLQCAPLLTGIKMSNLLHVREGQQREVASMFEATPVSSRILYKKNGRISVFLYREQRLKRFLSVGKVRRLLDSFGYRGMELPEILSRLSDRYQRHMDGRGEFPHEIGLLLGYPPEDVSGFIENGGKIFSVPATGRSIRIPPGPEGSLTDTTGPGRQPSYGRERTGSGTL